MNKKCVLALIFAKCITGSFIFAAAVNEEKSWEVQETPRGPNPMVTPGGETPTGDTPTGDETPNGNAVTIEDKKAIMRLELNALKNDQAIRAAFIIKSIKNAIYAFKSNDIVLAFDIAKEYSVNDLVENQISLFIAFAVSATLRPGAFKNLRKEDQVEVMIITFLKSLRKNKENDLQIASLYNQVKRHEPKNDIEKRYKDLLEKLLS